MTLDEAARQASDRAETFVQSLRSLSDAAQTLGGKPGRIPRPRAGFALVAPPANLAEIIRSAEVHRTFIAGPPSPEMQKVLFDALFHPRTFRAVNAPGMPLPGRVDPQLAKVLFDALFNPPRFRALNAPGSPLPR